MNIVTELHAVAAALARAGIRHALCGGVAVTPAGTAARLERLRAIYVPERDVEARQRLDREARSATEPFALGVARRLEELRVLAELSSYLHSARQVDGSDS